MTGNGLPAPTYPAQVLTHPGLTKDWAKKTALWGQ